MFAPPNPAAFAAVIMPSFGKHSRLAASLGLEDIRNVAVALPPLAEQELIVKKVSDLMDLCSDLNDALIQRENLRGRLLDSILATAFTDKESASVTARGTTEVSSADQRHMSEQPTLFECTGVPR
jgi:hypothetical protein